MKKILMTALLVFSLLIIEAFTQGKKEGVLSIFEQPILITSAGQNAEVHLASVLAKRAELISTLSKNATVKDLENIKTIVVVMGTSLKGLGAAGLDMAQEKERINLLVEEAHKKNIPLLFLHLGGEARRGKLSDEFINTFLPHAKMVIVVKSGNKDGLFNKICDKHDIHLIEVEKTVNALEPFKQAFYSKE